MGYAHTLVRHACEVGKLKVFKFIKLRLLKKDTG